MGTHRKQKTVSGQEATRVKDLETKQPTELSTEQCFSKRSQGHTPQYWETSPYLTLSIGTVWTSSQHTTRKTKGLEEENTC